MCGRDVGANFIFPGFIWVGMSLFQLEVLLGNFECSDVYFFIGRPIPFHGCVCYIFAGLLFRSKREHLLNYEKYFLFHFQSSFRSGENQILDFQIS